MEPQRGPAVRPLDAEKFVENRADVDPPNLDVPIYELDTTEDHNPKLDKVVKWIKEATEG